MDDKILECVKELKAEELAELECDDEGFYIPIECPEPEELSYDNVAFQKGLDDISYVCGMITGICNTGVKPDVAIEYIVNKETIKHNLEVTKIGANATIEAAKYTSIKSELENI